MESSDEESQASSGSPGQTDDQEMSLQEHGEARDDQAGTSGDGAIATVITAEQEQLLLGSATPGESPTSDASSVTGHMAALQVATPPHEAAEDSETS